MLAYFAAIECQRIGPAMHGDPRNMTPAELEEWRRKQMAEWMQWRNDPEKQRQHYAGMRNACRDMKEHP